MSARNFSIAAASSALAAASVYSYSNSSARKWDNKSQKANNPNSNADFEERLPACDHDDYLRITAECVLNETRQEGRWSVKKFNEMTDSTLADTKVKVMVAARFLDVLTRSASTMIDYKFNSVFHKDEDMHKIHERNAKSLHKACSTHGGLLVKLGQYVATTSGGFIPQEYVDALKLLQDECAPLEVDQVVQCIEAELRKIYPNQTHHDGPLWKLIFDEIEPIPLGSASLAQVHSATLKDGRKVALKVQRPNLESSTKADMVALALISRVVEKAFPGSGFDWML